jgi:DNA replication protein DnaC
METNLLLKAYLKRLRLPAMGRDFEKLAAEAARTNLPYERYLLTLVEQEVLQREQNTLKIRIKRAGFPVLKTLDTFDFNAAPAVPRQEVLQLADRSEWVTQAKNLLLCGNPGTGKTHLAIALGIGACRSGHRVRFFTAAHLVTAMAEAQAEHRLVRLQKQLDATDLVIVDELGYVSLPPEGPRLLFDFFARRYERRSVLVTTNLEFSRWPEVLGGDEMMTGALIDRLTHHCTVLQINGESYRFRQSRKSEALPKEIVNDGKRRDQESPAIEARSKETETAGSTIQS